MTENNKWWTAKWPARSQEGYTATGFFKLTEEEIDQIEKGEISFSLLPTFDQLKQKNHPFLYQAKTRKEVKKH